MILPVFVLMLALALGLIILGMIKEDHSELAIIGFVFLIFLSGTLRADNLMYKDGENVTYIYGNNFSGYHWDYEDPFETRPQDTDAAFLFHKTSVANYVQIEGLTSYGWWLTLLSGLSIAVLTWKIGSKKSDEEEGRWG